MNELFEMKLRNKELETKVLLQEEYIRKLEGQLDRYDTNLKISMQTNTTKGQHIASQVFHSKLYDTVQQNLDSLKKDHIQKLLEIPSPAISSIVHLLEKALQGPHSKGQILKLTTNNFCKYLSDENEVVMDNINIVFDKLCSMVYNKCSSIITEITEKLEKSDSYDESVHLLDTHRYNNIMTLHESKFKQRLLKEIQPIIK